MRKLRSRRNLVDSAEATNNATFEISVAPLGDAGNEVESTCLHFVMQNRLFNRVGILCLICA